MIVLATLVGVGGALLVLSGGVQPRPSLTRTIQHLQRSPSVRDMPAGAGTSSTRHVGAWLTSVMVGLAHRHPRVAPTPAQLHLVGRSTEQHMLALLLAGIAGLVGPTIVVSILQSAGVVSLAWFVPAAVAVAGAVVGPMLVHSALVERSASVRDDLRYQVSAYLDVVTMLLAGNTGYEGALEQASHAGDGRLFVELRRRMRESGARGVSLTDALRRCGTDLDLEELEQIAATAALSADEGAPVARTLAAKCATLRSALATEQEAEARLRTSRLTTPIVGMALIFMALVIYPALTFS